MQGCGWGSRVGQWGSQTARATESALPLAASVASRYALGANGVHTARSAPGPSPNLPRKWPISMARAEDGARASKHQPTKDGRGCFRRAVRPREEDARAVAAHVYG